MILKCLTMWQELLLGAVCAPMSFAAEVSGSDVSQLHRACCAQLTQQVGAWAQCAALSNVDVVLDVFTIPFGSVQDVETSGIS